MFKEETIIEELVRLDSERKKLMDFIHQVTEFDEEESMYSGDDFRTSVTTSRVLLKKTITTEYSILGYKGSNTDVVELELPARMRNAIRLMVHEEVKKLEQRIESLLKESRC